MCPVIIGAWGFPRATYPCAGWSIEAVDVFEKAVSCLEKVGLDEDGLVTSAVWVAAFFFSSVDTIDVESSDMSSLKLIGLGCIAKPYG